MHPSSVQGVDDLLGVMKEFAEERKWYLKYAKFNWRVHQSLFAHCLNVSSLSHSLLDYLDELQYIKVTDKLRMQVLLTGFLHDAGKESESFQGAVDDFLVGKGSEPLDFSHQQTGDLRSAMESLQKIVEKRIPSLKDFQSIWDEIIWSISQMGRREDAGAISHSFQRVPSNDALICKEIVHLADIMMSKLTVEDSASTPTDGQIVSKMHFTYSKVSTVRGVLTQFLHAALEDQFKSNGFKPIQWFPNGTVYVGKADATAPSIGEAELVESVVKKMRDVLDKSRPSQMAKAAYGDLTAQVIAAPEFLFASNEIIHEFWQYIAWQRFANPNIKTIDDLRDTESKLFQLLSKQSRKDEPTRLALLARFSADFNLLIILYATRKQLIEKADNAKINRKKIEEEATNKIQESLAKVLELPVASIAAWPEVALQTKAERRLIVAMTLWQSPYYEKAAIWREKFMKALEKATVELASMWRKLVPDKYIIVAHLLVSDVTNPLDPKAILNEVEGLNFVISKGKSGHGTPTCQRCGGVAVLEAQAELFGNSEIYSDNLIVGQRVGGGNKIQVCELCEFEEKLRSVFTKRGQATFFIFPQLALSRRQQVDWQSILDRIKYNPGEFPPLLRVHRWAERVIESNIPSFLPSIEVRLGSSFSEKELANVIQNVADSNYLDKDLSSMIEPPLDAEDGKTIAVLLRQGKCKLKKGYERDVFVTLNQLEPIYLSPNFILLITPGTVANREEPESSTAIKWTFFRCVLARLFSATVLSGDTSIVEDRATLGYTVVPSNVILKTLAKKLNARKGWIPISELDRAMIKLSALILIARELSSEKADYGKATLLRLLDEEPGRVLVRIISNMRRQAFPQRLITYLDAWNNQTMRGV